MAKLRFPISEVDRLIDHAGTSPDWAVPYGGSPDDAEPMLMFVKDDGIYLMSNGIPSSPEGNRVSYAIGYDPTRGVDVWEKCRSAVGGDDFAEYIAISELPVRRPTDKHLVINVTTRTMTVGWQ